MRTETEVSAHKESDKKSKSRKGRYRERLNITISPENYKWLEKIPNKSRFVDELITAVKNQIEPRVIVITGFGDVPVVRGLPSQAKGAGFRVRSRRGSRVQIPPPAFSIKSFT